MNEGGHLFIYGDSTQSGPSQSDWLNQLGKTPTTSSWEVLETVDSISDKPNGFAIVARRKRERSGIIEVLKMQHGLAGGSGSDPTQE
jgi:hypothetical protein